MQENEKKFERLEADNTTIRAENGKLLVWVETLSTDTTPSVEVPRAGFRVPVNSMQPLEEETTPIVSSVHQTQAADSPMTNPSMSGHFVGQ